MNNYQYITSKDNEKIKQIKGLENKKNRYENRLFVIEGIKPVLEAIDSDFVIDCLVYSKDLLKDMNNGIKMVEKIESINDIKKIETTPQIIKYLSDTVSSQGVIALLQLKENSIQKLLTNILTKNETIVILDRIQDAGNLGTIIRSANCFNVKNIICVKGTVDPYMPKVIRSTMGSILKVNIFNLSDEENEILNCINLLKKAQYKICVTSLQKSEDLRNVKLDKNCILIIGNEANGVSDIFKQNADITVKIPMEASAESLNVGVATGILLYNQYIE